MRADDGTLLGTLCGASASQQAVAPQAEAVLKLFSAMLANFMERELLVEQLRSANVRLLSYALSDPLTGLPNRRAIYEELERLQGRALREGGSILVGVIDLDGFKSINDVHGHQNGDIFLQEMGRRLAASLRASDMLGRLGGDEFVLIGPAGPGARRRRSHRPRGPARRGRRGRARWRTARPRPRSATSSWVRSRCPTTAPASAWWRWIRAA